MKRLTLEDIGKLAGVSRATVSRVVNGYPHIKPDVRERVEKVIAETGFRPNAVARSLASNRSNLIGLIVPSVVQEMFSDPYYPTLIQGVTQASGEHGQIVSLYLLNSLDEEKALAESIIRAGFLDGIILVLGKYDLRHLAGIANVPFVTIGQPRDVDFLPYVDTDNFTGGYLATKHLLDLGHRRVGIIAAYNHTAGELRFKGYLQALADYGIEVDPHLIAEGDFSLNSGYQSARRLLAQRPTAIFSASDRMAVAAIEVIKAANLRVPDDIAIVGFDNLSPALHADPPLTTIRQQVEDLGWAAVDLLMDVIAAPGEKHGSIMLPSELIIRESCGAKKKRKN